MQSSKDNPLLILDLDETLIFGTESEIGRPCSFEVGPFFIYERPHLHEFLNAVSQFYDLAVWSSASYGYVNDIASRIVNGHSFEWVFVWSRSKCVQRLDMEWLETVHLKDLKKTKRFGYSIERTLIVDDTPQKVARNYGNAIYSLPFEGDESDGELVRLALYLEKLQHYPNFREIEKRGWRRKV